MVCRIESFVLQLPQWLTDCLSTIPEDFPTADDRMALINSLAKLNVKFGTGGPFAAGIFDSVTHRLVSAGVNLVTSAHASIAHAEIVAITLAQQVMGHHDLGAPGFPPHELVTSTAPCAMCLGAIPWSGVQTLTCGARDEDARAIGFDEGAKPPDWVQCLTTSGISVIQDVRRNEAIQVLKEYQKNQGCIYNGRQGSQQSMKRRPTSGD